MSSTPGLSPSNQNDTKKDGVLGLPTNVILPPPEIREIIDKSAGYVARNGPAFEEKIRQNEQRNPKFAFLQVDDPYYKYYQHKLEEARQGKLKATSGPGQGAANLARPITKSIQTAPPAPPPYLFSEPLPSISAQDLNVLRLTARYAAIRGPSFIAKLSQKEWGNTQFDFLHQNHALYSYFMRIVQQYSSLVKNTLPPFEPLLRQNIQDPYSVLTRIQPRVEWQKYQETQREKRKEELEREKIEYAQIDWNDFAVVEVIQFTEADETAKLSKPTNLADLQTATLEQKSAMFTMPDMNYTIEEAPPTSAPWEPLNAPAKAEFGVAMPSSVPSQRTSAETSPSPAVQPSPMGAPASTPAPIRASKPAKSVPKAFQRHVPLERSPFTGEMIPANEMGEHMRVHLLDPRWREQRKIEESRRSTLNLENVDVAANMKRLVSNRTDIFDVHNGIEITPEEVERRKRAATQSSFGATLPPNKRR
ncbi:splicing factor Sap114 [Schizosaccharomyces cryophilus OY26]|uniref:Splicing factor Sap114 n=1 Tax=Schizosaccharomyces cryophilus (strain OY26 / ATCC MYA-4695 / CBS 11777 / NBRC 106824 / NRRL Y48691) TaxID=653667 RepID=S9VSJ4_SCHCR|nr:splicing factor Sap114 [Schizosaccharomyces cryophilus OY26]EPY50843.1 splicing factor Sap114 [Schizosaccharomyces cryophilus OY26]